MTVKDTPDITFRTAKISFYPGIIVSEFNDGKINEFYYDGKDDSYADVVKMYGYETAWEAYALEHELAHHFIADALGWKWSWSLHSSAGKTFADFNPNWPNHIEWEEGLVNALQNYMKTGTRDQWNVLHLVFDSYKLHRLCRLFEAMMVFVNNDCPIRVKIEESLVEAI